MRTFHNVLCFLFVTLFVQGSAGETLLVSHNNGILRLEVEDKTNSSVIRTDQHVVAFDIHHAWGQLYWATVSAIYRTPLYDLETTTLLAVVGRVGSLAVDWVHHHLYWTDLSSRRIEAAHVDGRRRRVVHETDGPMGAMVLDPLLGKLFWIEWNESGDNKTQIRSCGLDGSLTKVLYEHPHIPEDTPLSIDVTYSSIYFYKVAGNRSELWEVNYGGIDPVIKLFEREELPPKTLCLAKNGFYFSNQNGTFSIKWVKTKYTFVYGNRTDHIFSLDPYFSLLDQKLKNSSEIRVMGETAQPQWPDHCAYHQCQQECVADGHHHQNSVEDGKTTACICRYGWTLREDRRTCAERGYLIYSPGTTFGRITPKGEHNTVLFNDSSANIETFDVDAGAEYIYWADSLAQAIYRAPIEQLSRMEVVVPNITAYGVAVDWLHGHVYWTDNNRILLASVDKRLNKDPLAVLENLDSPANMAVDPQGRYIFWVECGNSLSIKRAGLNGSDVTVLVAEQVTCGMSLTADHDTSTLYWLDWEGTVRFCGYDGSNPTKLDSDVVRGVAILDHQPLWTPIEYSSKEIEGVKTRYRDQLQILAHDLQPSVVKVVKSSVQPRVPSPCDDVECEGFCLPTRSTFVPVCVCSGKDGKAASCTNKTKKDEGRKPNSYLTLLDTTPFSVRMKCAGPLLSHPQLRPWIQVEEVDSLVDREYSHRMETIVRVENKSLPFTIDGLNPATTYRLTVANRVTRAAYSMTVHTAPPPLAVRRLPIVLVPGIQEPIPWRQQSIHYNVTNPWELLVKREFMLLLISGTSYTQSDSPVVPQAVSDLLERHVHANFIILKHYKTEEEFDDDPVMYLANIPWGEEFWLAMAQTTEYRGSYNLDMVYSEGFSLPDPYWRPFLEDILEDQDMSTVGSIERT